MICREISINEIDSGEEAFRIGGEILSAPLTDSIRSTGQLNPVVLLKGDAGYRLLVRGSTIAVITTAKP